MFDSQSTDVLDSRGNRRTITYCVAGVIVVILLAGYVPSVSDFYEQHHWLQNLLNLVAASLTLALAYFEVRHSDEANRYRKEANDERKKANELAAQQVKLTEGKVKLERDKFELQNRVQVLQEQMAKIETSVRLFPRVRKESNELKLSIDNLSEFDLWLNQVQLIITEIKNVNIQPPKEHTLGGMRRLSKGATDTNYLLYGTLMKENNNQATGLDITFEVRVSVTGVMDKMETIFSPKYRYSHGELIVLSYKH